MTITDLNPPQDAQKKRGRKPGRKAATESPKGIELLPEVRSEVEAYLNAHPMVARAYFWKLIREKAAAAQRDAIVGKLDQIARGE